MIADTAWALVEGGVGGWPMPIGVIAHLLPATERLHGHCHSCVARPGRQAWRP
ncbi:MAG: hypothetical protein LC125_08305 [Burkholderiales bacterium]|nr:hypothetical protein [Burkholderiales bacterium]